MTRTRNYNQGFSDGDYDLRHSFDPGVEDTQPRLNRAPDALRLDPDYRQGYADARDA